MYFVDILKKFIAYYKPYKKVLFADLFFASLASVTVLAYPMLVNQITNNAISDEGIAIELVVKMVLIFGLLMVVEYASNFYTDYFGHVMGAKIESDMRNDLFEHIQKLSFQYHDNTRTGQLMSRITTDLFDVSELAHHGPEDTVISMVRIMGSFFILVNINWMLTLVIFLILPLMLIFAYHYSIKMKNALKKNKERIADINSQIEDSLSGIRVVQSFANEEIEMDKFRSSNHRFLESRKSGYRVEALFFNGLTGFISFINISVVIVGAILISYNQLLLTELITFLLYINTLIDPVKRLVNFTNNLQNGVAGFERFMEILAVKPDIMDAKNVTVLSDVKGKVEFVNVGFQYSSESNYVFSHINITVNPGEYVALVGSSGVGKTTLCSLIPRFYETSEGLIKIDDTNIKTIKLKSLRDHIGIVQQDIYLFSGTVKENILYGKPGATDEEIITAARNANAHEFIMGLPGGYNAYIGQRGVKLSGGQKQRISIARVFLKNPAILILDEATSALDNESESLVQQSLEKLAKNRTTFVIAHRLSTIRNAQRIIVLSDQGIAEEGTHANLIKIDGVYAKLYNMQFNPVTL
ncbi:ABC transporter ATP-binding protein/permease [Paenibacillus sp. N5-1-1-5]|uniref:ABC transporter ATP-binding protein/permease n=1 Tax=Paenibacillus radicis (ex Xue et al. 2023) TaxID=2972489 RepID=A0ABT1YAZ4_9BACL|nr:ABC transporter ATP-binding protein [Paenibacillus radicis (ex Xue et al. 2023)]MCR8630368.1 ABC transporter ATP-binding protein/permease [Paenibacillus radicis (ex Xue et al. 2023)]